MLATKSIVITYVALKFIDSQLHVALIKRDDNTWGLPGTYMHAHENLRKTRDGILHALSVRPDTLLFDRQITLHEATTQIAGSVLEVGYLALRTTKAWGKAAPGVKHFPLDQLPPMHVNDRACIHTALTEFRMFAQTTNIVALMAPQELTRTNLHTMYVSALGAPLNAHNFKRNIVNAGIVTATDKMDKSTPRRAKIYHVTDAELAPLARRIA